MASILIIDDDAALVRALSLVLSGLGHLPDGAMSLAEGLKKASGGGYELVILDVRLPDGNGLEALTHFKEGPGSPEVIILTGAGDPDGAEMAIRSGAWSYITKPPTMSNIRLPVERAVEYHRSRGRAALRTLKDHGVVGESAPIRKSLARAAQASGTDVAVLITGATGTGKELVARAIHRNSRRRKAPFVVVDCAALPDNLVESMLFGHERGAFTGADRRTDGLVLQANGGTLFLDEVGELPLSVQGAFLRVLQDHRFRPVGGAGELCSDFRLVAATNRDLEAMAQAGQFREDLLFRIRGVTIQLPPLAQREDDARLLAQHFLERLCEAQGIAVKGLSTDFVDALLRYHWPGNVRELMGAMESALASAEGEPNLLSRHLPTAIRVVLARASVCGQPEADDDSVFPGAEAGEFPTLGQYRAVCVEDAERRYLTRLMALTEGKIAEACRLSELSRARLYALLKLHGISRPSKG